MAKLVFVHGAFANEHSWFNVPLQMEKDGHEVVNKTLPGHVFTKPIPEGAGGLEDYVLQTQSYLSGTEKTWLIGHSMGGMVISQVAAQEAAVKPDKIAGLIYVAAILPQDGQSTSDFVSHFNPLVAFKNHDRADIKHALSNQPPGALSDKFHTSSAFPKIPKYYFICLQDKVISKENQYKMASGYDDVTLFEVNSDHLPMHPSPLQPDAQAQLLAGLQKIIPA